MQHNQMHPDPPTKDNTAKYYLFGSAQLLLAIFYPILALPHAGLLLWMSLFWLMIMAAVRATNYSRKIKKLCYALSLTIVFLGIGGLICYLLTGTTHHLALTLINSITFLFLAFITTSVLFGILTSSSTKVAHLVGAASAYILIGISFAYGYMLIHQITATPLLYKAYPDVQVTYDPLALYISDYLYFSFVTLTTLGFGDLSPSTLTARVLSGAEAIGQLYLTILIARLVALNVVRQTSNHLTKAL